jgi:hypothetical protein
VAHELKIGVIPNMGEVGLRARKEIVYAQHFMARLKQPID